MVVLEGIALIGGVAGAAYLENRLFGTTTVKDTSGSIARAALTTGAQGFTHRFLQRSADAAADVLYGKAEGSGKRDTIFLQQWKRGRSALSRGRSRSRSRYRSRYRPQRNRRYQARRWARKYPYQAYRNKRRAQTWSRFRASFGHLRNSRFYRP